MTLAGTVCTQCRRETRPGARFCGHCGNEVVHPMQLHAHPGHDIIPLPQAQSLDLLHEHNELAAHLRLEVTTRLNPLMNQERMKAIVMTIAAQGGTGTVGFWCDD